MTGAEDVWREHTADVLAALLRRSGDFGACEDAVQEALLAAAEQWPREGRPDDPKAWLVRVASRRLIDAQRSAGARERREEGESRSAAPLLEGSRAAVGDPGGLVDGSPVDDDTLRMAMLCAHPDLSDATRVALTLRAVAGLTTAQVAACFLVPEATMAQRISRAKATIRASEAPFAPPTQEDAVARLHAVRHVVYLAFTAGHTSAAGDALVDVDLQREALRLAERLHRALPRDPETAGLLALLLIDHARSAARTDAAGDLVPLDAQDRSLWDHDAIARGVRIVEEALVRGAVGPFQLQAAIAAVHGEAPTAADTDWEQVVVLYRMLLRIAPSPVVELNLAAAVGMAQGAAAGLVARAAARGPGARTRAPGARRPRPPARAGRSTRRSLCRIPARGQPHPEHPRAALPQPPRLRVCIAAGQCGRGLHCRRAMRTEGFDNVQP
ncbi:RNA polymerase sigma factor [Janibacter indicus]|uniref:RNA polymerase sigma factor n=1 Tax=Janibacter indicus TaxID=857417 RepID=UPI00093258DD|nr:sigma-70 family RNA polymerase sigma factor [Janibacter indicus]